MVLGKSCQFLVVLDGFWLFFGGYLWFLVVFGFLCLVFCDFLCFLVCFDGS